MLVVLLLVLAGLFLVFSKHEIKGAIVYPVAGEVYYKSNASAEYEMITAELALPIDGFVKTGSNGEARIEFRDGVYAVLAPNTEVSLKDYDQNGGLKVELEQTSGKIWNRIFKFSGSADYTVGTGSVVASVRGTGFATLFSFADINVKVVDGNVNVLYPEGQDYVPGGFMLSYLSGKKGSIMKFNENDDDFISRQLINDRNFVANKVKALRKKYALEIAMLKTEHISDETVDHYLRIAVYEGMDNARGQIEKDFKFKIPDKYLK